MSLLAFAWVCAACAIGPALLFARNLMLYKPLPPPGTGRPRVSLLIPARNEEAVIGAAIAAALESTGVDLEVVVLDDASTDRTTEIVEDHAHRDPRVRLAIAPPLPAGWCGKQHACAVLARQARHDLLAFVDADVRLAPDALARAAAFLEQTGAGLVSGFPRQETGTLLERLLLPLMHFVLLGFLPIGRMRASRHPAFGAGCGQWFLARRDAYQKAGGHGAIRGSLHDGLQLPRAFRRAGIATDLFDATDTAACRMYHGAGEVWNGLAKNATEGLASAGKIVPATVLLVAGQIAPLLLTALALTGVVAAAVALPAVVGTLAAYLPRLGAIRRFRQPLTGALLHPVGIAIFLVIQWYALGRKVVGQPAGWKGRVYSQA